MKKVFYLFVILSIFSACGKRPAPSLDRRPNIVLIVADDMGYSDLGCYGSEIATPNIDELARQGQIFTSFYTAATCSPTRAMLLSGTDNHIAGLGTMAERVNREPDQLGQPGYEGYLNDHVVSVSQLLKDNGYHTYTAGKWHLGLTPDQSPEAKGFERSFSLLSAYAHHFNPDPRIRFWVDDHYGEYPEGKYSTDFYTDKLIDFIRKDHNDNKPFFLYAAYTSPHWPLQVPPSFSEKYKGVYDIGFDSLRSMRFQRSKEKGIVEQHVRLPKLPVVKGNLYDISDRPVLPWKSLTKNDQIIEARKMELYAGMIDNLDHNIGRLIQYLKDLGEYDNTFFVFISDNGPDNFEINETPDVANPLPYMGTPNSFVANGAWAHASSGVNRLYKGYSAEGGIHCPLIIKMPFQKEGLGILSSFTTVMDMAPTFLEIADVPYPKVYQGRTIASLKGESILPLLKKQKTFVHNNEYIMGWELFGRCALRKGEWKICKIEPPFGTGTFELFNIQKDPTESNDLSKQYPDKYLEMLNHWKDYVKENGVIELKH